MKFEDALKFLDRHINYEKKTRYSYTASFSLKRIQGVLSLLGDPHQRYTSIVVAGTNGKGSTAVSLARLLAFHGLTVGVYTSPHLVDVRERMRVGDQIISKREFARCIEKIKAVCEAKKTAPTVTYFELLTIAAFLFFARRAVDVCVAEVGLGGRLDATNVLHSEIAVLTPISYDHQAILGDTLTQITREKAGIIHDGAIVVSALQKKEARRVIAQTVKAKNAVYRELFSHFAPEKVRRKDDIVSFDFGNIKKISIALRGLYQLDNTLVALQAFYEYAGKHGCVPKAGSIRAALRGITWPGRFEIIGKKPIVILDGAHNPAAVKAVVFSIQKLYPEQKKVILYASLRDKEYALNLRCLRAISETIVLVRLAHARAVPIPVLEEKARGLFKSVISSPTLTAAFLSARSCAGSDGIILVTGSLVLVGECKKDVHIFGNNNRKGTDRIQ